jgi:carbamoyl-phosphate synthase small subunit
MDVRPVPPSSHPEPSADPRPWGTAFLALADGSIWPGRAMGSPGRRTGEVVFNTCMTGYQEVLTDPSYRRQIVVMTAPHIGNTGANDEDDESDRPWVAGFAVRAFSRKASSWRAVEGLGAYLVRHAVVGITEIDTRRLVRHIRDLGAMHGAIVTDGGSAAEAVEMARAAPDINAMDLVAEVSCGAPYGWHEAADARWFPPVTGAAPVTSAATASGDGGRPHVVVLDLGVKRNTLRMLAARGCRVTVVPARTGAEDILGLDPDGVLLSNGPGDPAHLDDIVQTVRLLLGRAPLFGICLGHQLLGLALGGTTYKLRFGHRGGNQPVRGGPSGRVAISSHNHGFALDADSLPIGVSITHVNLNDGCVEGLAAPAHDAFGVQYHPEAAPGPHDASELFDAFVERALRHRAARR